jgi:hypothetical protein
MLRRVKRSLEKLKSKVIEESDVIALQEYEKFKEAISAKDLVNENIPYVTFYQTQNNYAQPGNEVWVSIKGDKKDKDKEIQETAEGEGGIPSSSVPFLRISCHSHQFSIFLSFQGILLFNIFS